MKNSSARRAGFGVCGHGPLCTRERCRVYPKSKQIKLSRRDAEIFVRALIESERQGRPHSLSRDCWCRPKVIKPSL